jgi:2-oxo-4-hydroxy-4-carboxy-5-ureidoimidazoline decarboxylase
VNQPLSISTINSLDQAGFVAALSSIFEGPPWIAAAAWAAGPFADRAALHQAMCDVMNSAGAHQQIALIRAHPDLVGRAALAGTLTPESTSEQAAAGLSRLSEAEIATFTELNHDYQARFGFPFVICARENKKESILAGFKARMGHTREEEIAIALAEIAKIAHFRLMDTVAD